MERSMRAARKRETPQLGLSGRLIAKKLSQDGSAITRTFVAGALAENAEDTAIKIV
jgi:hypothetical protein